MRLKYFFLICLAFLLNACDSGPVEIAYGFDQCHYCHMTIVDPTHGAEVLNTKGKLFKYDAVECMINDLKEFDQGTPGKMYVNYHTNPGALIDASQASYLVCKELPSPMGANITAFETKAQAVGFQEELGGEVYNWVGIKAKHQ